MLIYSFFYIEFAIIAYKLLLTMNTIIMKVSNIKNYSNKIIKMSKIKRMKIKV
jgi:hypothetical protein